MVAGVRRVELYMKIREYWGCDYGWKGMIGESKDIFGLRPVGEMWIRGAHASVVESEEGRKLRGRQGRGKEGEQGDHKDLVMQGSARWASELTSCCLSPFATPDRK